MNFLRLRAIPEVLGNCSVSPFTRNHTPSHAKNTPRVSNKTTFFGWFRLHLYSFVYLASPAQPEASVQTALTHCILSDCQYLPEHYLPPCQQFVSFVCPPSSPLSVIVSIFQTFISLFSCLVFPLFRTIKIFC